MAPLCYPQPLQSLGQCKRQAMKPFIITDTKTSVGCSHVVVGTVS